VVDEQRLAKRARVTQGYVARLESEKALNPSLPMLRRLARALAVPVAELLERRTTSVNYRIEVGTGEVVVVGESVSLRISPLFEALLNSATHLLSIGQSGAAVLVAQSAIEVCTERIIAKSLERPGIAFLQDWIQSRVPNHAPTSDATRKLYQLLTGDDQIAQAPFWRRLTDHVTRRNLVAHRGQPIERKDAEDSVAVAGEVIRHLSAVAACLDLDLRGR
jgi:transcriptional regulator with XRE-family HTH domain